jgi:mono/diheme cytochrome c family protein
MKLVYPLISMSLIALLAYPAHAADNRKDESEKAGAVLYRDKGCAYCHGAGGAGTKKAPPLSDLWKNKTLTTERLNDQILNGGQKMPPFRDSLTDDEVADLVAWLRARKKPEPPPADSDATPAAPPQ